jgi:hypothetical protein
MPSPGEDIQSWSVTAADNGSADPLINWVEGQTRASVNNSSRSEMAAHAKHRNLLNGSIVTTGTGNAQAFLSGLNYTSAPTGLTARLKVGGGLTNDASITLNMDGIGDVLVKTATGDNLKGGEFVADGYVDLLYNGTNWVFLYGREFFHEMMTGGGGIIIGHQVFNTPGAFTYTPTEGMECCIVECIGSGGGGGGAYTGGVSEYIFQGGGGGGGGYSRAVLTAAQIGASHVGTIGAGGNGGTAGGPGSGVAGTATNLGTLCVAQGGAGGTRAVLGENPLGGAGGSIAAAVGDVKIAGSPGGSGMYGSVTPAQYAMAGNGAPGPFGGGAVNQANTTGANATGYGAGGSGGSAYDGNTAGMAGGNGSGGLVIITEFAGRGAPGRDGADGPPGPIGPTGPTGPGTGDVLRSGTPAAGQVAEWVDASHIKGSDIAGLIPALAVNLRTFTANGTYPTVTNGNVKVLAYCKGGGGSGGGTSHPSHLGGGGGEGEEAWQLFSASQLSAKAIIIGAGGAAIGGGVGSNGNTGGNTSIFGLMQCNGGQGGFAGDSGGGGGSGGYGGALPSSAWVMPGAPGTCGTNGILSAGGGKGGGRFNNVAGIANSGGGGHGGTTVQPGGAGGSGFVAFLEFGAIN